MVVSVEPSRAGAVLTVDLGAVRANYRQLAGMSAATCAAVMKADAYGLGMAQVAPALASEGCRVFFTAHLDEGIRLRPLLPADCTIYVLHGPPPGTAHDCFQHGVVPVLNDPAQLQEWRALAATLGRELPAAIQLDSGMSRMGISPADLAALSAGRDWLAGVRPRLVMSHLACADEPHHPMNDAQRGRFDSLRALFPGVPASLANSSGIFLAPAYHYDLLRPGAALYGINPQPGAPNPLRQAVSLHARIVQVRTVRDGDVVGYGAHHVVAGERRIATVAVGYADGWLRSLSGRGYAFVDGVKVPVVGRVSMDSMGLDVTGIAPERVAPGCEVELMGVSHPIDDVAALAGTIGYEVLTRLGSRFNRRYL
ncbi:alanine racemase [Massilia yuzhufengensis]|uniref:Alanine racemase n=1 Tax=Massilia yuzhufengensis TaxID=1164594 RepID=A0A1I1TVI9_9BURK|nr:alanine racemase [Massilia yuzhufengensis]SFD62405.1 alanine racemase [Massilia yuzhufengensis]